MTEEPMREIKQGDRVTKGYVLSKIGRDLWIGVKFGEKWKPARIAREGELKYFGIQN